MSRASTSAGVQPSALVAGMAAGDDGALGALYDAYGQVAYGLALAITGAQATAESVVSQAFGEAWRSASSFNGHQTSVLAWLTSIVRRTALGAGFVKGRRLAKGTVDADGGVGAGNISSATPVGQAMRALTDRQRQVIALSYYGGLTIGEIATQLGEPEAGTRELLRSAMHQLRSALPSDGLLEHHVVTRA